MKKVIRLTEQDLNRLVRRIVNEQFPTDTVDEVPYKKEPENQPKNVRASSPQSDEYHKLDVLKSVTIPHLEEIFNNFNKINCDNWDGNMASMLSNNVPEYVNIYCQYYKGKTRSDIHHIIKTHKAKIAEYEMRTGTKIKDWRIN